MELTCLMFIYYHLLFSPQNISFTAIIGMIMSQTFKRVWVNAINRNMKDKLEIHEKKSKQYLEMCQQNIFSLKVWFISEEVIYRILDIFLIFIHTILYLSSSKFVIQHWSVNLWKIRLWFITNGWKNILQYKDDRPLLSMIHTKKRLLKGVLLLWYADRWRCCIYV